MTGPLDGLIAASDPAMVVVTTRVDAERVGCLVGFHCQSSIDPLRYCVWMSRSNRTTALVRDADHVAVHFLTADQHGLAATFGELTGDDVDKFARVTWDDHETGVPLLRDCPNVAVLRIVDLDDLDGDHLCVTGEPVHVSSPGGFAPLRFSAVSDLDPGHAP